MIRRLIVPLTVAVVTFHARSGLCAGRVSGAAAQPGPRRSNAFAVSAGQRRSAAASVGAPSAFPCTGAAPISGRRSIGGPAAASIGGPADACMKGFVPLREEAEKRGKMIKAASERKAPPDEACKLIGNFGEAEVKMIKYVEANATKCGIPPQIGDQLKNGHKNTEAMQEKVCGVAQQAQHARTGRSQPERSAGLFGSAARSATP